MKQYTANYTYTNPNFVIQNLVENQIGSDLLPTLFVAKNILQRGFPTLMSKYLQNKIGSIHQDDKFRDRLVFVDKDTPKWIDTIKGDEINNYYPAKEFLEKIIPNELGEFSFIKSLLIPEIEINAIIGEENTQFINQQVDFYLPIGKLVIEIDGQQHKGTTARITDSIRDSYLGSKGIKTIRISTQELQSGKYVAKLELIKSHLISNKFLNIYKESYQKSSKASFSSDEITQKLIPTAIIRFQILLLELLINNYLTLDKKWNFKIYTHEDLGSFANLAIEDLFIWLDQLWLLKTKKKLSTPEYNVEIITQEEDFRDGTNTINIDFSLLKRYTDEANVNPNIIFVRTDYFDIIKERNYFKVSTTTPINYSITSNDEPTVEFFIQNIFGLDKLREGQFSIISNALNRKDTIGLLPTGGGKSLCYQLPCLLQPSINFVVCPIKSLMYDQKANMDNMMITNVAHITSDLDAKKRQEIIINYSEGHYLFIWVSPERFQIQSFRDSIRAVLTNFSIAYAVVDEVHCLSEWGHDFRTSYLNLAKTIDLLSPKDTSGEGVIKFIGLTATASVNVLKDIKIEFSRQAKELDDDNIKSLLDYSREELEFKIIDDGGNKRDCLKSLLGQIVDNGGLIGSDEKSALIFTPNVNGSVGCYQVSNYVNTLYAGKSYWYSGSSPKDNIYDSSGVKIGEKVILQGKDLEKYKNNIQKGFKENKYPILVATKAFGMGIDKKNIYYTIHYGLPASVESLYQEAGRAGRWDKKKSENESKKAKCYVLYSPEIESNEKVTELFEIDTSFSKMRSIQKDVGRKGKDVFSQIFLFLQGQNDVADDLAIILNLIELYFKPHSTVRIHWNDVRRELAINEAILEKAIYRLSLLGIVRDWTTDFINYFEVMFNTIEDDNIIQNISLYINKYESELLVEKEIGNINKPTLVERSVTFLLQWIFNNMIYNRKQSLKTLVDWCNEYKDSESFKARIDNYFRFSESTFILQHIAENPKDYEQWFKVLYIDTRNKLNEIEKTTYIPEIEDVNERVRKFQALSDGLSRFLESFGNNTGLNFLSGLIRLFLNEYDNIDGRERFEISLLSIQEGFELVDQTEIIDNLIELGTYMSENSRYSLSLSVTKYYPNRIEYLAEKYGLPYLLDKIYKEKVNKIQELNRILYEQFGKI